MHAQGHLQIVGIGGGFGMPMLLRAVASQFPLARVSAVVAVTDNGRSTGTVRSALRIPAPGDLRHCLTTMAGSEHWARLLEHRLEATGYPDLDGMALGNLVLGALVQQMGDIGSATSLLATWLETRIDVLPVSVEDLHLAAQLADGTIVHGETGVREPNKPRIVSVFTEGETEGIWPPAAEALRAADIVIIGPGSLWTSLAAVLAVPGVREAIPSNARAVYIANTTRQLGQTDNFTLPEHVEVVAAHLGRRPDVVLCNTGTVPAEHEEAMCAEGLHPLTAGPDEIQAIEGMGVAVAAADLIRHDSTRPQLWHKQDTAYHNPERTAAILAAFVEARSSVMR